MVIGAVCMHMRSGCSKWGGGLGYLAMGVSIDREFLCLATGAAGLRLGLAQDNRITHVAIIPTISNIMTKCKT